MLISIKRTFELKYNKFSLYWIVGLGGQHHGINVRYLKVKTNMSKKWKKKPDENCICSYLKPLDKFYKKKKTKQKKHTVKSLNPIPWKFVLKHHLTTKKNNQLQYTFSIPIVLRSVFRLPRWINLCAIPQLTTRIVTVGYD